MYTQAPESHSATPIAGDSVRRFYRFHAPIYDVTRPFFLWGRKHGVAALGVEPGAKVLDVGCGTGLTFSRLQTAIGDEGRLFGVDFSTDMLSRAQRRVDKAGWQNVTLAQADVSKMTLTDRFDAAIFAYSLSMIPPWREALQCVMDHLVEGGRLVVLDFAQFHGWGPIAPVARWWLRYNHVETVRPYTDGLRDCARKFHVRYYLGGQYFVAVGQR